MKFQQKRKERKVEIRNSNGYSALIVVSCIGIILVGYFIIMPVFGQLYDTFYDDSDWIVRYPTEESCVNRGSWYGGTCHQLSLRAKETMEVIRSRWLFAPIVFIISMIIWYLTTIFKEDPQQYYR